jgi:RimK-like ATP-grasp domain
MILLWGDHDDSPLLAVAAALSRRGIPVLQLGNDLRNSWIRMTVSHDIKGTLCVDGHLVQLSALRGAYLRPGNSVLPLDGNHQALISSLSCWAELATANVVNRPSDMASNNSKPYQSSLMRAMGFLTPETLVTTDPAAAKEFWQRHGRVVYKSVSGVRSTVAELSSNDQLRLADVSACPTQFQRYIAGDEYRVHVVDSNIFATRIHTSACDYRYPGTEDVVLEPAQLPLEIESLCLNVARGLGLRVAGIDLRHSSDGNWYALEANPSPAFTYYASQTGQPIAEAIAGVLCQTGESARAALN